ncbi:MAG TPA: hypothetical protein VEL31_14380 [Ktedonobacteraceae bacterium]|nr:hypothetical protein [Ktedonobacteraceae bacterium]
MSMSQQGQNQRAVRELSAQEVYNYFYPRPTPKWNIGAIVFGVALIPVGIFLHSILLSVAGPIIVAIFGIIIYRRIKSHPDDESYDAWVGSLARKLYARGLDTLDIQLHNQDQVLTIRSYVLPGSLTAHDYLHEEVLMKHGKDGRQRFSINVYTFIFCTARFLAIFESDVNVFNPLIHRDIHEIYGYPTIFTATTIPLEDTVVFDEQEVPYRTELFCLKFVNGETGKFSAAVKARPWGSIPDAPAITLPSTNFDKKLSKLRQILLYHQK